MPHGPAVLLATEPGGGSGATFLWLMPENCVLFIFQSPHPEDNHLKINPNLSGDAQDQSLDMLWISVILT